MTSTNPFIMMGVAACIIVLGIIGVILLREKERRRRKKFDVMPPF